ncbi:MAG: hypothetical protein JW784_00695 [Candidatus Cloacimonetes bacterium]|nr:hypothetical protein [Candidatus Cloacimonadota bacterium]
MLVNPSFELPGSNSAVFSGWQQVGITGSSNHAVHGFSAAKLIGQNDGNWNISVFWQNLDCESGEQWEISGHVKHSSAAPLAGDCVALVNVEWRDVSDLLIDYETFTVADYNSIPDEYIYFELLSTPAPSATAKVHLLVGLLQSPTDPSPEVTFDQITFFSTAYPTFYDMQWDDFPNERIIEFANMNWKVKGPGLYDPGLNYFCPTEDCTWVDNEGHLHLMIRNLESIWYSSEIVLEEVLGYGDYIFTILGALDQIDEHAILGLFLWQYGPCWEPGNSWWNPYNEIDVEIGRWGDLEYELAQFVAQPWDWEGNLIRFDATYVDDELSSFAFRWLPDRIEFRSWYGGPDNEDPENMIFVWTYEGFHIPRPEIPRVHINLWQYSGPPAEDQEVVITDFNFIPLGGLANPVENLTINIDDANVYLQWSPVAEASEYNIYESESPEGPWIRIATCSINSQSLGLSGNKKFYQVTWE